MARDKAYYKAEKKIEEALRTGATELDLRNMGLTELPDSLGQLAQLVTLNLTENQLTKLPGSLSDLTQLEVIYLDGNQLVSLPGSFYKLQNLRELWIGTGGFGNPIKIVPKFVRKLRKLKVLDVSCSLVSHIPDWVGELPLLEAIYLNPSKVRDLPVSLLQLEKLESLDMEGSPLNPELAAAAKEGLPAVMAYLRAKESKQITLNEAKLILVGEGEVGKTCLMDALEGLPWAEHISTHGIEIRSVKCTDPDSKTEITLNGWDFGGQRVYRPTHQLFFSSPAVYLVVWKPRGGPQQGFVREWIKLIKHREPDAKILVVATHGGPNQRQPDIDKQELRDLFGKETVIDFFFVDSKPENGTRRGIEELRLAIAKVAAKLPEMGRSVPKRWQDVRNLLSESKRAYWPLSEVLNLCEKNKMDKEEADLFVKISHRLGHLIHYEHDPTLRDIVVLKPDWLATAISFVLDDEVTRKANGLVSNLRLRKLWNDPNRKKEFRYSAELHPIFLRLMERFDLSYQVAVPPTKEKVDSASLIAQLVLDNRPEVKLKREWPDEIPADSNEQMQICKIVDARNGQSATAEGLFYQLIVRLHKYSLGRNNYNESVHWQRGLVLDADYNGRALLKHVGNDVHIFVRAAYPERLLTMLTEEVKYLVESFWEGLRCEVMVPCANPCGKNEPGIGLFEVEKLIAFKRQGMSIFPCISSGCNQIQDINALLRNAPSIRPVNAEEMYGNLEVLNEIRSMRQLLISQYAANRGRFGQLAAGQKELLSKADASFNGLIQAFTDEAKEGPRLFSLAPVDRTNFNPKEWTSAKFRLTMWCEHSSLPLPVHNEKGSKSGVYEIEITRNWLKKASPYLKFVTGTLSLVLPVASAGFKLAIDDETYKAFEEQLDFGEEILDASLSGSGKIGTWLSGPDTTSLEHGEAIRSKGASLRELHSLLRAKDPTLSNIGLVRVMNKRQQFLWVHPQFEGEY